MKEFLLGLVIAVILTSIFSAYAAKVASPPPLPESPVALQHYLQTLYSNIHALEVTTTAPNGSRRGTIGTLVIYDTTNWELWVKTDTDSTSWQKIGP